MSMRLIAMDGGPDVPLAAGPVVVGRHPACDAWVGSMLVSRRHCCLAGSGGEVLVRDLGSTNGTWINGRRVESGRLRPGDELAIGGLRYRMAASPPPRAGRFSEWF
jgi:pSer/pThr/pTyr-binding forkhead associated (FHA) protein